MNPTKVIDGIEIYGEDNLSYIELLLDEPGVKEEIAEGTAVIFAETTYKGNFLQHCYGIDFLLELLEENPEKSVLCLSTLPANHVRGLNYRFDILGYYQNATFFEVLSIKDGNVAKSIREARENREQIFREDRQVEALARFGKEKIARIVHRLSMDDPKNPQGREVEIVEKVLTEARNSFSSLRDMPDDEVIDFLIAADSQREEVMKGENISGVYCDVEGTLLTESGALDKLVLQKLSKYPAGKITLWTDGDVEELQSTLREFRVNYPVKRKSDFAGATAEIVIDDLDEKSFTARTKIRAQNFIQVK